MEIRERVLSREVCGKDGRAEKNRVKEESLRLKVASSSMKGNAKE